MTDTPTTPWPTLPDGRMLVLRTCDAQMRSEHTPAFVWPTSGPVEAPGYGGTSISGYGGTSTSGDGGTSTSGYGGTSTSGDGGTSTSGYGGTSTSGDGGTSTSGYGGIVVVGWWDSKAARPRLTVGYVGEGGIKPDTTYRCSSTGALEAVRS